MADFDLSQLGKQQPNSDGGNSGVRPIRQQNITTERIDTTAGKIQPRKGNYVSPAEASRMNTSKHEPTTDPIFDTPPTFKVKGSDSNIQSLDDGISMGANRTPVNAGKPAQTPKVHSVKSDTDIPDPTPLKVVNNFAHKFNDGGELTPFDPSSLPKKKPEMGHDEEEDMALLEKAVEREKKSISERVQALTNKQYEEYLEARAEGKQIARPMTDEEVAAEEEARINGTNDEASDDGEEIQIQKRIVIAGDEDDEVGVDNSDKVEEFGQTCMNAIRYVDNHSTSKDYFTRVLHARSYMAKNKLYSEIWAIVMYNHDNESVVHPFLVAKKDGITAIVECNLDNIKGVHTLDPNDTVESLYIGFQHKGYLYEYIDYLAKAAVVKLPADMPTLENALKLANEKLGVAKMEDKNPIPNVDDIIPTEEKTIPAVKDELDDAINADEAAALYGNADEEVTSTRTDDSDNIGVSIDTEDSYETKTTYSYAEDVDETEEQVTEKEETPVNLPTADELTEEVGSTEDNDVLVISKDYEGPEAFQLATSDDLAKDLEHELDVNVDESGPSDEDMLNELKDAVKKNIPSIKKRINLREFKISDTPISAAQVAGFSIKDINQADWVLPNAQRVITVRGLSGPELFSMNPQNSNKNRINTFRQIYGIIYKHIVSKKPKTFDEWLKVTRFSDIDHIYAALHRATFAGSNFVHYECPECKHVFIKDYPFEDMVKYRDDKAEAKIKRILNSADSSIAGYDVKLSQISDDYVVGLKDPSIWNMVMETAALSEDFLTKYEDLLDTMSFIDSIYVIDRESGQLRPVDFDYDKDNPAKSTARKIMILSDIIRTLSSDSYFDLRNQIAQLFSSSNDMTYRIPAAECPHCKHKFEEEPTDGNRMLFTRHQLGALAVI